MPEKEDQTVTILPMGFFYFDESIHPNANFALGAFVYAERDFVKAGENSRVRAVGQRPI